jgi:hypothetical protein
MSVTPKTQIVKCASFDVEKFTVTELSHDNERSAGQSIAFPRYNEATALFVTNPIELTYYGIHNLGDYVKSDKDREYVKIPYDENQPACVELFTMLEALDKKYNNYIKDFSNSTKFEYIPLVRESNSDKPKYCKLKLETDFIDHTLKTRVYLRKNGKPILQNTQTITELADILEWRSTANFAFSTAKLWVANKEVDGVKKYGLTLKALQIEIIERAKKANLWSEFDECVF